MIKSHHTRILTNMGQSPRDDIKIMGMIKDDIKILGCPMLVRMCVPCHVYLLHPLGQHSNMHQTMLRNEMEWEGRISPQLATIPGIHISPNSDIGTAVSFVLDSKLRSRLRESI